MKLTRVTITGADDGVSPADLISLSREFPFVEWAILGSKTRRGTPRYPTDHWMDGWMEARLGEPVDFHWAVHLCGELSRRALSACQRVRGWLHTLARPAYSTPRAQLNGFSEYRLPMLALAEQMPGWEFILQCENFAATHEAEKLHQQHPNVSILWDASGGRGIDDGWDDIPCPTSADGPRYGWAGGVTVENIESKIEKVLTQNDLPALRDAEFWLDLESGCRTEERFDLNKARRILELAKPFVSEAA